MRIECEGGVCNAEMTEHSESDDACDRHDILGPLDVSFKVAWNATDIMIFPVADDTLMM